jgi:GT2 family glycosyltransferase
MYGDDFNFVRIDKDTNALHFKFKHGGMEFFIYPDFVIAAKSATNFDVIDIKNFAIEFKRQNFVETYEDYPKDSVFEIAGAGFGCCIMRMSMVKDLIERCKGNPFQPLPELSEDYSFCYRAKQAGYRLWCDSRIRPGHAGLHVYTEKDWTRQQKKRIKDEVCE